MRPPSGLPFVFPVLLLVAGCKDTQSVLAPHGPEAARLALLSWVLIAGGLVILVAVLCLAAAAIYGSPGIRLIMSREATVIGGGVIFPAFTLSAMLIYGLGVTRAGVIETLDQAPLRITITGERWWWRIQYDGGEAPRVQSANELRIPVGRPIALTLRTADVIHSFWVPNLAGKVDMIPGRTTRLSFTADTPGVSRGQCAEYCGGAHALMAFHVVALPPQAFDDWMRRQVADAKPPASLEEADGQRVFIAHGCGGCHTIRGTPAKGTIGPDLTHIGGRLSLAAATLPNSARHIARWISDNQTIKPENLMLPYAILVGRDLAAVSAYLSSLK